MRPALLPLAAAALLLAGAAAPASGQNRACKQIAAELAAATASANAAALRQAGEQRRQYQHIQTSMAEMGCGGLFGAPAQCTALRQKAAGLAGSIAQLEGTARGGTAGPRHAQLLAAYDSQGCGNGGPTETARVAAKAPVPPAQARGLLETLFGGGHEPPAAQSMPGYATATLSPAAFDRLEEEARRQQRDIQRKARADGDRMARPGGGLPVCVRICDGFFFPVNYQGADSNFSAMCEASCPGASTELYWMRPGADIAGAVSARGASYSALPTAHAFQRSRDESCSCKGKGEAWGAALQRAESLMKPRGDIVVTDASATKMARPAPFAELRGAASTASAAAAARTDMALTTGTLARPRQSIDPKPAHAAEDMPESPAEAAERPGAFAEIE